MQHSGTPQQFCLRWNNYQSNLTNVFDQLLQSESFVDVTLACDGHSVKAHKMVLSACSPYFQALFFDNPCQHPIVILKDIKWPELKAVVEFMYKGEINVSQEQIGPLLKVAESLKIRGLADVNGDHEASQPPPPPPPAPVNNAPAAGETKKSWDGSRHHHASMLPHDLSETAMSPSPSQHRHKKRRRLLSGDRSVSVSSPEESAAAEALETSALEMNSPQPSHNSMVNNNLATAMQPTPISQNHSQQQQQQQHGGVPIGAMPGDQGVHSLPPPPPNHPDEMEIKPGIAEMIREEERAKLLESSQAWLGASTSSIAADSYQYQLQSMWQKCWNTNQSLVHNLRFRERGPLKSWRPETMAEAIFSVLKEGLSLSQAARKYDIPYPTFVLYANRVHNMLGPSIDGGADLRPKGRGRPQRILLGSWPEEHIRGVIRAVVFRDTGHIKEEPHISYPQSQHAMSGYSSGCGNGPEPSVSPTSAAAAAVAVVAQGLRQQMCSMVAAAQHHAHLDSSLLAHCGLPGNGTMAMRLPSSPSSPAESAGSPIASPLGEVEVGIGVSGMAYKHSGSFTSPRPETLFQEDIDNIVKSPMPEVSITKEPREMMTVKLEPFMDHD